MKGIITEEDWNNWKNNIVVDFIRDNHFTELKDADILKERLQTMDQVSNYVGEYFSKEWVMKNVLNLGDDDIKDMKDQIDQEKKSGEISDEDDEQQNGANNE
jgi:bacterioferritin (cytochrome b1)